MHGLRALVLYDALRLRSLFRRGRVERELEEEMAFYVERRIKDEMANGRTPEEA